MATRGCDFKHAEPDSTIQHQASLNGTRDSHVGMILRLAHKAYDIYPDKNIRVLTRAASVQPRQGSEVRQIDEADCREASKVPETACVIQSAHEQVEGRQLVTVMDKHLLREPVCLAHLT